MRQRQLPLTPEQRQALGQLRDTAPQPYLRARAAALLKVAAGLPAAVVARQGLLRRRKPDTVYAWLDRSLAEGVAGLKIRRGRGRKPAFPPRHPDAAAAGAALRHLVRRDPRQYGHAQARWTLPASRQRCPWLRLASDASLSGLPTRPGLSWQRARSYSASPDPAYFAKLATVAAVVDRFLDPSPPARRPCSTTSAWPYPINLPKSISRRSLPHRRGRAGPAAARRTAAPGSNGWAP